MKKGNFIIFLTIIASLPIIDASIYTYLHFTLYNAMYLIGAGVEYAAIAIALFFDILTDWENKVIK